MSRSATGIRYAEIERETKETRISVAIDLDGGTSSGISSGIGFFDHMLEQLSFHSGIAIGIQCEGDRHVDDHHSVEDIGIVLGHALRQALGQSNGRIRRYASNDTPMDEALVRCAIDISGRGYLSFDVPFKREMLGSLSTECIREFFKAFAAHAQITLHLAKLAGENDHHLCEACFKAVARALSEAIQTVDRSGSSSSTKGSIG